MLPMKKGHPAGLITAWWPSISARERGSGGAAYSYHYDERNDYVEPIHITTTAG
jgi:hypothetical protein